MSIPTGPLTKLVEASASVIAERTDLTPEALQHLTPGISSSDFAKSLASQGLNSDAAGFLAHGLEQRVGVQWAVESVRLIADKLPPEELKAMQAAEAWTEASADEGELEQALGESQFNGPGSWAAQAALWSAKALEFAPPGAVAWPLAPKAIEGAVKLAAVLNQDVQLPPPPPGPPPEPSPLSIDLPISDPAGIIKQVAEAMMAKTVDAAATPLTAEDRAALNDALAPFVDLGLRLAGG